MLVLDQYRPCSTKMCMEAQLDTWVSLWAVVFLLAVAFFLAIIRRKEEKTSNSGYFDYAHVKCLLSKGRVQGGQVGLQYLQSFIISENIYLIFYLGLVDSANDYIVVACWSSYINWTHRLWTLFLQVIDSGKHLQPQPDNFQISCPKINEADCYTLKGKTPGVSCTCRT